MVLLRYLLVQTILSGIIDSLPTRENFKHVSFIKKQPTKRSLDYVMPPFNIEYKQLGIPSSVPLSFQESVQFWDSPEDGFPSFDINLSEPLQLEIKNGHVTPDFSNGLQYPDPFLLAGPQAKRAAAFLYSRELFFGNIPHARALLYNQEQRKLNGLPLNKLGSLNSHSPFWKNN